MRATKCSRGIEEPANNVSHVYKYSTNVIIMTRFFYCREKDLSYAFMYHSHDRQLLDTQHFTLLN